MRIMQIVPRSTPARDWLAAGILVALCCASSRAEIVVSKDKAGSQTNAAPGLTVPAPDGSQAMERFDMLEFLSGDKLRGTFFSIDPQKGIRWRHPSIRQVLEVDPAGVGSIKLDRPQGTNPPAAQVCVVRLTNEDELVGELASMDATNLVVRTWYAGLLTIPRAMTRSLSPGLAVTSAVYEGPKNLDGWKRSKANRGQRPGGGVETGGWNYRKGAFYCGGQGTIGRELALPPVSNIEFDLAWNGYMHMAFSFYTDNVESYGGNCYMLQFSSGSIYLQRMSKDGNSNNLGHSEASALAQKSKVRVSIRSHKERKGISLFLDNNLVKQWTDRGEFATGNGISFYQQGQGIVRVSNIRITEWNGKLDSQAIDNEKSTNDLVRLGNNDQITGSLKSIQDGKMQFGTEFATLEVPLNRIAQIDLAKPAAQTTKRQVGDIRAVFVQQGSLTCRIERWDDHQILAHCPGLGQLRLLPSAFARIDFNLDQQRADPDLLDLNSFEADAPLSIED